MDKIMEKLKNTKILGICGNALVAIGTLVPLYSISFWGLSQNFSFVQGIDGIAVLLLSIIAIVMIFADKLEDKLPFFANVKNPKFTLIPVGISALLLILAVSQVSSSEYGPLLSFGIGFYLIIVGLIAAVAYPFLYKGDNN